MNTMAFSYCPIHGDPQACPTPECARAFDATSEDDTSESFGEDSPEG